MGYDYDLDDIEDKLEELSNLDYVSQENTDLSMEKARQISENTLQNVTDNMKGSREGEDRIRG